MNKKLEIAEVKGLKGIKEELTLLKNGEKELDFFGIHSIGIDCIYFMLNDNKNIDIHYEFISKDQLSYKDKLEKFVGENNIKWSKGGYGNSPNDYQEIDGSLVLEAPVYFLEINTNKEEALEIGLLLLKEVFNTESSSNFEIVP